MAVCVLRCADWRAEVHIWSDNLAITLARLERAEGASPAPSRHRGA